MRGARPWIAIAPLMGFAGIAMAVMGLRAGREVSTLLWSKLAITGIISSVGLTMFPFILPSTVDPHNFAGCNFANHLPANRGKGTALRSNGIAAVDTAQHEWTQPPGIADTINCVAGENYQCVRAFRLGHEDADAGQPIVAAGAGQQVNDHFAVG